MHPARLATIASLLCTTPALGQPTPRLDSVTLSSGGVGQYTYTAHLDGPATIPLDVAFDQVDDLLASLSITDPAGGTPSVRLPGRTPLREAFRALPFAADDLATPESLLQALVGAQIRLPAANVEGAIVGIAETQSRGPNDTTLTRHRLTLATTTGLATVILEDQLEVQFASPQLRAQLAAALAAAAEARAQNRRTLSVTLPGAGPRDIRLAYVVPAPVWKAAYRLTLDGDGTARLKGYAVVENLTGQDWHAVHVTLTSGEPVLFHQPLYGALFTDRPEAPIQASRRLTPAADQGAQPPPPASYEAPAGVAPPSPAPSSSVPSSPVPAPRPSMARALPSAPPPPPEPGATATQDATQVEFRLDTPVDATAGQSLLLPIVDRPLPTQRVALFTPQTGGLHPFVALRITNDSGAALPPGLATLYAEAGSFIGDALLPATNPGEDRLLSFASDLATRITRIDRDDTLLAAAHATRGALVLTLKTRNTTTYRVTTAANEPRHVLIEQPLRQGWDVIQPTNAARTPTSWRIAQDVPAATTVDIPVVIERTESQSIDIARMNTPTLVYYAGNDRIDPAARAALDRIVALRADLATRTAAVAQLKQQVATIVADQERVRANLASTGQNQALQRRYTAMLQDQEDTLTTLRTRQSAAQSAQDQAQAALDAAVAALTF